MVIVPASVPTCPRCARTRSSSTRRMISRSRTRSCPTSVVPIDPVIDQKVACIDALESQFYEWNPWLFGYSTGSQGEGRPAGMDRQADAERTRRAWPTASAQVDRALARRGQGREVRRGFEVCEYGTQPSPRELLAIFPFFKQAIRSQVTASKKDEPARQTVVRPCRLYIPASTVDRASTRDRRGARAPVPWIRGSAATVAASQPRAGPPHRRR